MPPRTRYFHTDGPEAGLTPSQLKRSSRDTKLEYMEAWFKTYFEDPSNQTPYNSREGGFQWIWGGPYDAYEQLFDEFGGIVDDDLIRRAAEGVEGEYGVTDWAPSSRHPNMRDREEEARLDREDDEFQEAHDAQGRVHNTLYQPPIDERLAVIEGLIRESMRPSYGSTEERTFRSDLLDRIGALEAELAKLKPAHGGMGHNNPPEEIETPSDLIREVKEATTQIREELAQPEPDAGNVLTATKTLNAVVGWVATKLNNFVDATVKSAGDTTGKLLAPFIMLGGAALWVTVTTLLAAVVGKATGWLELITFPF